MNRVAADGERAGYFAEDARAFGSSGAASGGGGDQRGDLALKDELKEMAAQERREDAGEFDRRFARNVARDARFKGVRVQPDTPTGCDWGTTAHSSSSSLLLTPPRPSSPAS